MDFLSQVNFLAASQGLALGRDFYLSDVIHFGTHTLTIGPIKPRATLPDEFQRHTQSMVNGRFKNLLRLKKLSFVWGAPLDSKEIAEWNDTGYFCL